MSRLAEVATVYKDEGALRQAIEHFGLRLVEGGQMRKYHESIDVDLLVKLPGKYDVGFKRQGDGSLTMLCDSECYKPQIYDGSRSEAYGLWGKDFNALSEEYSANVIESLYSMKGYSTTRERLATGELKVTATRG